MRIEPIKIAYKMPLAAKYLYDFPALQELFTANPASMESFHHRFSAVLKEYRTDRRELMQVLLDYNRKMGCGIETEANLEKLLDPKTVVVITGQQAGLFTGPLYTIHKTISVIQLARKLTAETGYNVLPVFWIAAEDHDFGEINHVDISNKQGELARLTLQPERTGKVSIGDIPVMQEVFQTINELEEVTNPAHWKDHYLSMLRSSGEESENMADWFARIMTNLFGEYGLILANPMLPGLRKLTGPLYEQFLIKNDEVNEGLRLGQKRVMELGFVPQVDKSADHVHLFRYVNEERLPVLRQGDHFLARGYDFQWSREEMLEAIREKPTDFSPNVVLRPVAQDYLFPLLAYVGGPGEISYYALYKEIYPLFNMSMPLIFPRAMVTLIEANISRLIEKYNLSITDIFDKFEAIQKEYLKKLETVDIDSTFSQLRQGISRLYDEVGSQVAAIDPELEKVGQDNLQKIMKQVDYYMGKAQQSHRKQNEIYIRQMAKISQAVYPKGQYQERFFNIFPYLFKYGPGLLQVMMELPLIEGPDHKLVYLNS